MLAQKARRERRGRGRRQPWQVTAETGTSSPLCFRLSNCVLNAQIHTCRLQSQTKWIQRALMCPFSVPQNASVYRRSQTHQSRPKWSLTLGMYASNFSPSRLMRNPARTICCDSGWLDSGACVAHFTAEYCYSLYCCCATLRYCCMRCKSRFVRRKCTEECIVKPINNWSFRASRQRR
jgi:hypothetical protein